MRPFVLVSLVLFILPATSRGDQVSDRIENAKKLYEEGSYSRAVSELKAAIASIQSLQADGLKDAFPKPLPGWSADEPVSAQAGMQFLGGGIAIRRRYRREGGEGEVEIGIVTESPLLQSVMMLLSNPLFTAADKSKSKVTVGNYSGILEFYNGKGELDLVVGTKTLVTVGGSSIDDGEILRRYAEKIDFDRIRSVVGE